MTKIEQSRAMTVHMVHSPAQLSSESPRSGSAGLPPRLSEIDPRAEFVGPPRAAILIADSDVAFCNTISAELKAYGFYCACARDGPRALDAVAQGSFDLLIAETQLPGSAGLAFVEFVAQEHDEIPILLVTAAPRIATAVQAMRLGVADYLIKPVDPHALLEVVQRALDRAYRHRRAIQALHTLCDVLMEQPPAKTSSAASQRDAEDLAELSTRERQVALTFVDTPSVAGVAEALGISVHTVRNHFRSIYRKLGIRSQAELIARVRGAGGGA